jgi:hypothetical protein
MVLRVLILSLQDYVKLLEVRMCNLSYCSLLQVTPDDVHYLPLLQVADTLFVQSVCGLVNDNLSVGEVFDFGAFNEACLAASRFLSTPLQLL